MSVIAARVLYDRVLIAADSILLKEELKRTTNFTKLRQINNMIIGGCGSAEELSLMFLFAEKDCPVDSTIKDVTEFLYRFAHYKETCVDKFELNNCYLIVYKGHLFETDGLFVQEIQDYTAIGEGEPYALTALHLGQDPPDAIDVACDLCCCVARPIIYFSMSKENNNA